MSDAPIYLPPDENTIDAAQEWLDGDEAWTLHDCRYWLAEVRRLRAENALLTEQRDEICDEYDRLRALLTEAYTVIRLHHTLPVVKNDERLGYDCASCGQRLGRCADDCLSQRVIAAAFERGDTDG